MFTTWRQPRLWLTALWTLVLACGLAGWDLSERRMQTEAGASPLLLLPDQALAPEDRQAAAVRMRSEPGVGSAHWIAPAELSRVLSKTLADAQWRALLPTEDQEGWLPWLLEIVPADPLGGLTQTESFVVRRKQEGGWSILWDGDQVRQRLQSRRQLRWTLGLGLSLVLLIGVAGLHALPWPKPGGRGLWIWSVLLGIGAPLSVAAAAMLSGAPLGARTPLLAAAAGFLLAGAAAPMLRQPQSVLTARPRLSFMVKEAPNERK